MPRDKILLQIYINRARKIRYRGTVSARKDARKRIPRWEQYRVDRGEGSVLRRCLALYRTTFPSPPPGKFKMERTMGEPRISIILNGPMAALLSASNGNKGKWLEEMYNMT